MKNIVLCFFLVLCFFIGAAVAEDSIGDGFVSAGVRTYFPFGMKNSRGDSAWCNIWYAPTEKSTKEKVGRELKKGVDDRKNVFEKTAYEKIIDETEIGKALKGSKMEQCTLCVKFEVAAAAGQTQQSHEEKEVSPPVKNAKTAPPSIVTGGAGKTDDDAEKDANDIGMSGNGAKDITFPIDTKGMLFISLFVNVALLIFIIIRCIRGKNSQEQMDFSESGEGLTDWKAKFDELKERYDEQIIKYGKLKSERDGFEAELNALRGISAPIAPVGSAMMSPDIQFAPPPLAAVPQPQPEVRKEIFYFSNPNKNTFDASRSTPDYVDGKSLYRFERVVGENTATVVCVEDEPKVVLRFIQNSENHLGVCDFLGGYKKDATAIVTEEPGSAVLDDDGKWTVKKKIKIRYN